MKLLKTEQRNPETMHLDRMSTEEMASWVIRANYDAVRACEEALSSIARAVDAVSEAFQRGGRLFYLGAGTSGRLGVLDASECPPTFGVDYEQVQGIIAGGKERMFRAGENAEDKEELGRAAVREHGVTEKDVVVGISAAGGAAFVLGALAEAKALGCVTVGIANNPDVPLLSQADIPILADTGAEVLTGSTRMKAGTAQKIILNALSTCAMVKTGKVYENMMINLSPSNQKLKGRVIRIVREVLSCDEEEAVRRLEAGDWCIRTVVEQAEKEKKQ